MRSVRILIETKQTNKQTMNFRILYRCILKRHKGKTVWFGQYDVENGHLSLDLVLLLVCTGMVIILTT